MNPVPVPRVLLIFVRLCNSKSLLLVWKQIVCLPAPPFGWRVLVRGLHFSYLLLRKYGAPPSELYLPAFAPSLPHAL